MGESKGGGVGLLTEVDEAVSEAADGGEGVGTRVSEGADILGTTLGYWDFLGVFLGFFDGSAIEVVVVGLGKGVFFAFLSGIQLLSKIAGALIIRGVFVVR